MTPHAPSQATQTKPSSWTARRWRWLWALAAVGVLVCGVLIFFPWNVLREPLNQYVSKQTGRHFEITRRLDVKLGRVTRIVADGLEFANPPWAQDPFLVRAERAEIHIRLWPLLTRRIDMPRVVLQKPQLGLQLEPDGRRSWALGRDTGDQHNFPEIGQLVVDEGQLHYVAGQQGADVRATFSMQAPADELPLHFEAKGRWQNAPFTAQGRASNVLLLQTAGETVERQPFAVQLEAAAGSTRLTAQATVQQLAPLNGLQARVRLQGANLADLYTLAGVVLPQSPHYVLSGQLTQRGDQWQVRELQGQLGDSDVAGSFDFVRGSHVPTLRGTLQSRSLDFDDLAPLVGLPEQPPAQAAAAAAPAGRAKRRLGAGADALPAAKVLPTRTLDLQRLRAMNADVRYSAQRIVNARGLPLDRVSVHVMLQDGVLRLDPLDVGVAGGSMRGSIRIDGREAAARVEAKLNLRGLALERLVPAGPARASFGRLSGDIDLAGQGNSTAQMLGGASGQVAVLMGKGQISNLLLEVAGLDGAEVLKFLAGGDRSVSLRCAAAAFDVNKGVMDSRALLLDTTDTVIQGQGRINLADETLDVVLRPSPKDKSILSLRSPIRIGGTFGAPRAGPDGASLAVRGGLALALGAINPLLALAATVETGPGQDADCQAVLRQASAPKAAASAAR